MSIVTSPSEDQNPDEILPPELETRGRDFGNTCLSNRQIVLETGGEDTAEISVGVFWPAGGERPFFDVLEKAKEKAQRLKTPVRIKRNGLTLAVHSRGWGSGGGEGVYFDYQVDVAGISLGIPRKHGPNEKRENLRISIGSLTLMKLRGLESAWRHALGIIEQLSARYLWNRISRIDSCIDIAGQDVGVFVELVRLGHVVTRIRRKKYHEDGTRWTGVTIAPGGATVLRVYDKALEVYVAKPDPEKARLLEELRWGAPVSQAVRLEWQLRRSTLADFGVASVEEYLEQRAAITLNLMSRWFRLTVAPPDRENNNTQRAVTHPMWDDFLSRFFGWMGATDTPAERIGARPFLWPARDAKQALGCLLRVLAYDKAGELIDGVEIRDCLHAVLESVMDGISNPELARKYESKAVLVVVQVV